MTTNQENDAQILTDECRVAIKRRSFLSFVLRHCTMLLLFCFYSLLFYHYWVVTSERSLAIDEFNSFTMAKGILDGLGVPKQFNDTVFLIGLPRAVIHTYATAATMQIFGVSEGSARVASLIFGIFCGIALYAMLFDMTKNKWLSLCAFPALLCEPLLIQNSLVVRFYSVVVFLHILTLWLFMRSIEVCQVIPPEQSDDSLNPTRASRAARPWLMVNLGLFGAGLLVLLNANNSFIMALLPVVFGSYAFIFFLINVFLLVINFSILRKRKLKLGGELAYKFIIRYAILSALLALFLGTFILVLRGKLDTIPVIAKAHEFMNWQMDVAFHANNWKYMHLFFPEGPARWLELGLLVAGMVLACFLCRKPFRSFGLLLALGPFLLLSFAIMAFPRYESRYLLFLKVHTSTLYIFAIFGALYLVLKLITTSVDPLRKYVGPVAFLGFCLITIWRYEGKVMHFPANHQHISTRAVFGTTDYREVYDNLMKRALGGDIILLQAPKEYYLETYLKKYLHEPDDFHISSIPEDHSFRIDHLLNVMEEFPSGWFVWLQWREHHLRKDLIEFVRGEFTPQNFSKRKWHQVYSWTPAETDEILARYRAEERVAELPSHWQSGPGEFSIPGTNIARIKGFVLPMPGMKLFAVEGSDLHILGFPVPFKVDCVRLHYDTTLGQSEVVDARIRILARGAPDWLVIHDGPLPLGANKSVEYRGELEPGEYKLSVQIRLTSPKESRRKGAIVIHRIDFKQDQAVEN